MTERLTLNFKITERLTLNFKITERLNLNFKITNYFLKTYRLHFPCKLLPNFELVVISKWFRSVPAWCHFSQLMRGIQKFLLCGTQVKLQRSQSLLR